MSIVRTFLHLLLSLALVAGGLVPDIAMAAGGHGQPAPSVAAVDAPPCHAATAGPADTGHAVAGHAVDKAPGCCDDGACTCDCLHHAPLLAVPASFLVSPPADRRLPVRAGLSAPDPAPLPSLRPPIA